MPKVIFSKGHGIASKHVILERSDFEPRFGPGPIEVEVLGEKGSEFLIGMDEDVILAFGSENYFLYQVVPYPPGKPFPKRVEKVIDSGDATNYGEFYDREVTSTEVRGFPRLYTKEIRFKRGGYFYFNLRKYFPIIDKYVDISLRGLDNIARAAREEFEKGGSFLSHRIEEMSEVVEMVREPYGIYYAIGEEKFKPFYYPRYEELSHLFGELFAELEISGSKEDDVGFGVNVEMLKSDASLDEKELEYIYHYVESMLEEYIGYDSVGLPLRVLLDLRVKIPPEGSARSELEFKLDMVAPDNLVEGSDEEEAEEWKEKIKSEIRVLSLVFLLKPIGKKSVERERYLGIVSFPFFVVRSEERDRVLPKTISYKSFSGNAYVSLVDKREVGEIEPIYLESVELPEHTNLPGFGVRVEGDGVKFSFYNYEGERVGKSELVRRIKEAIALSGKWGTPSTTYEVARAMSMIYSYYNDELNSICVDDGRGKRVLVSPKVNQDEVLTFILEKLMVGVLQKMKEDKDKEEALRYLKEHHFNWILLLEAYEKNSLDEIVWAIKRGFLNYHFVIQVSAPPGKTEEKVGLLDLRRYGKVGVVAGEDERYRVFVS